MRLRVESDGRTTRLLDGDTGAEIPTRYIKFIHDRTNKPELTVIFDGGFEVDLIREFASPPPPTGPDALGFRTLQAQCRALADQADVLAERFATPIAPLDLDAVAPRPTPPEMAWEDDGGRPQPGPEQTR